MTYRFPLLALIVVEHGRSRNNLARRRFLYSFFFILYSFVARTAMLDRNLVRENPDWLQKRLSTRGGDYPLDELVALDSQWKAALLQSEHLRQQRNEASEQIGKLKREGRETATDQARVKEISNQIKLSEEKVNSLVERLNALL